MSQIDFINEIAPIIKKYSAQYGYHTCAGVIAQACCESGFGNSWSRKYNNFFGIKYGTWVKRTAIADKLSVVNANTQEEYTVGSLTTIVDGFVKVIDGGMDTGVRLYFEFLRVNSRYKNLLNAEINSAATYLAKIKADGYATSSTYIATNMAIVNRYNLSQYDSDSTTSVTTSETVQTASNSPSFTVGHNYTTQVNLRIRTGPGTNYRAKSQSELTASAQAHAVNGVLNKGTRVTVQDVYNVGSDVWVRIPSGWIAALYNGKTYVS